MPNESAKDLQDLVVLVTSEDPSNTQWGTAFVIHRDEKYTYFLTCAHVVHDVGGDEMIKVGDRHATVVAPSTNDVDMAVLRVEGRIDKPTLHLRSTAKVGSAFRLGGFAKLGPHFQTASLKGTLGKPVDIHARGKLNGYRAWQLRVEGEEKLQPGLSGSPVVVESGHCVAIATYQQGQGERGIAISVEVLSNVWPDMPHGILAVPVSTPLSDLTPCAPRMNLEDEVDAFVQIALGRDQCTRALVIHAPTGMGKTRLLDEYEHIAQHHELPYLRVNLNQQISIEQFLCRITNCLDKSGFRKFRHFRLQPRSNPVASESEKEHFRLLTGHFFEDILLIDPEFHLALFIDQYEKADQLFKEWLNRHFLPGVVFTLPLVAVVAGQEEAAPYIEESWLKRFKLEKLSAEWWHDYLQRCGICLSRDKVRDLHKKYDGVPFYLVMITPALKTLAA